MTTWIFCPYCDNLLYPKVTDEHLKYHCDDCNYQETAVSNIVYRKSLKNPGEVFSRCPPDELPFTKSVKCPECGGDQIKYYKAPADPSMIADMKGKCVAVETEEEKEANMKSEIARKKGKSVVIQEPITIPDVRDPKGKSVRIEEQKSTSELLRDRKGKSVMIEEDPNAAKAKGKSMKVEEEDEAAVPPTNNPAETGPRCRTPLSKLVFICANDPCYHYWEQPAHP